MHSEWDFDTFLSGITPALVRYCAAVAGGVHGEDAAQEALIRLWQNRERIPTEAAAAVFVYRTAYRLCVDALRRQKRQRAAEQAETPPQEMADRLSDRMKTALKQLSPADRAIVYSRVLEEASYGQIAERFGKGKTEAWARKRYSLARAKLEKLLGHPSERKEEKHG